LCGEVGDPVTKRRFCGIPLDGAVRCGAVRCWTVRCHIGCRREEATDRRCHVNSDDNCGVR
jgi:hypothetical protein